MSSFNSGADPMGRAVYVISVAAELAGVHPQTLRVYERRGLVDPLRTRWRLASLFGEGSRTPSQDPGPDRRRPQSRGRTQGSRIGGGSRAAPGRARPCHGRGARSRGEDAPPVQA